MNKKLSAPKLKMAFRRRMNLTALLFLAFVYMIFFTGCTSEDFYLNDAAEYFKEGNYKDAETSFLRAIRNGEKSLTVYSGYAFNQLKAGDIDGAKALFELMINQNNTYGNYFDGDSKVGEAVRKGLLSIYLTENDYESAVILLKELGAVTKDKEQRAKYKEDAALLAFRYYSESLDPDSTDAAVTQKVGYNPDALIELVTDSIEAGNENVKMYRMRADLYWIKKEWDKWEADERKVIELKDFAIEEYNAIYGMYLEEKNVADVLSLVDEVEKYVKGHSAYVEDYGDIIPMVLKAADYSSRVEWEHDSQYYFDLAESYIQAAEIKNASDNQIIKYKIIVAERKGKMELAYKLLGVYLEHVPDDKMAYKEQKYLENRLGLTSEPQD